MKKLILNSLLTALILLGISGCGTTKSKLNKSSKVSYPVKPVVLFILDTSESMMEQENGKSKINTARSSIINTISQINKEKYNLSLITFNKHSNCRANVAISPNNKDATKVIKYVKAIKPDGHTPLAEAITLSGKILNNVEKKIVILFSDGEETCGGDPVLAARILDNKYGIKLNLQVIGYKVSPKAKMQLEKIAQINEQWAYHSAKDAAELSKAINTITKNSHILSPLWLDINTSTFQFTSGSKGLKKEYVEKIRQVYEYLQNNNNKIIIIGHTDSVGTKASNQHLSLQRANEVKLKLIELGINSNRISIDGKGENKPISSNDTEEGRLKNRRVVIKILENTRD